MKDIFFIQIDDNGISLSSNMLTWIDPLHLFYQSHCFPFNIYLCIAYFHLSHFLLITFSTLNSV